MKNITIISAILYISFVFLGCSKEKLTDRAGNKMQDFVINIARYARAYDSNFIIIPQNGIELAFNDADPGSGIHIGYIDAVNGFGVEELFYNGGPTFDRERVSMLRKLKETKKILVSEYVKNATYIPDAIAQNEHEGFVCFIRSHDNYNYEKIPDSVHHANSNAITSLNHIKNYLYLINADNFPDKEAFLRAVSATEYDLVLMDLFFNGTAFTASEINRLKTKPNGARRLVISYINIGAAEKFRYYWKKGWGLHHPLWLRRRYEGYNDEFWVKFWKQEWQEIIYGNDASYIKKIIDAGFDGAYLDNVEAYYFLYHND